MFYLRHRRVGARIIPWVFGLGMILGDAAQAWAASRDLYVASRNRSKVVRYDGETGAFVENFVTRNSGGLDRTQDLAWGADGHLYVTGIGNSAILRFHGTTGDFLGEFTSGYALSSPTKFVFRPDGYVYVSQWGGSRRVVRFDAITGAFDSEFTSAAVAGPCQPAWDAAGNLYLSYWGTNGTDGGVRKFDSAGQDQGDFDLGGVLLGPTNLWFDGTDLVALDWTTGSAERFDAAGQHLSQFLTGLTNAEGITFDDAGQIYVCDWSEDHVRRYDATGAFLGIFASGNNLDAPNACVFGLAQPVTTSEPAQAASPPRIIQRVAPNPFRFGTTIDFSLLQPGPVRVRIVDVTGREVSVVADRRFEAGSHSLRWEAGQLPPGIYYARLESQTGHDSHSITRIR